jgi:hypothetical protein
MEKISIQYFGFTEPKFKEKIILPNKRTILKEVELPQYEINQDKAKIDDKYKFIDIDKLMKRGGKKYTIADLRDIASKLNIPITNSKPELTRLIKLKIGIE